MKCIHILNKLDFLDMICGVKELSSPGPLHTGPKAHAEEEETLKDEQRESKLPRRKS